MLNHPSFLLRPALGQFAKNGTWEKAWAFDVAERPDDGEVRNFLAGTSEVAFEAFFGEAFIGVRCTGEPRAVESQALQWLTAMESAVNGVDLYHLLVDSPVFDTSEERIAFAEIGMVNAWGSSDRYRFASPGVALEGFEAHWSTILHRQLGQDPSHRKAIEFVYLDPVHHWIGLPVSSPMPPFRLDPELLRKALKMAAGIPSEP